MICASASSTSITVRPRSPMAAMAVPKKIANTTICKISLRAMASITLLGTVCSIKPVKVSAPAWMPELALASGSGRSSTWPGSRKFTNKSPSVSETNEAKTNQASALPPTRPTVATSLMRPSPTASVENTSGAMIILIRRRKISGSSAAFVAKAAAESGNCVLTSHPPAAPVASPTRIKLVSRLETMPA